MTKLLKISTWAHGPILIQAHKHKWDMIMLDTDEQIELLNYLLLKLRPEYK